jgi:hypothetical protein
MLSGTPTTAGLFDLNGVTVTDSAHPPVTANGNFSVTIAAAVQISTTILPGGTPSVFYTGSLTATGGFPPYLWAITQGALPNGLTLNATSGVISGTPADVGTSNFTVQASDSGNPAATAPANLSIMMNQPPPRNAALYLSNQTGLQIQSDGSLTLLPSSPESAIAGQLFGSSPTLPILFLVGSTTNNPPVQYIESVLVNPDYSITLIDQGTLQNEAVNYARPVVDPTGSNLYLPGPIDSSGTAGITIYPGNGSTQSLSAMAVPNVSNTSPLVFTPAGPLAFIALCSSSGDSILNYARNPDGGLTPGPAYALPADTCVQGLAVSLDGGHLATWSNSVVRVYSIASDGSLSTASQPLTVTLAPAQGGNPVVVHDMTWDESGAFLIAGTGLPDNLNGGMAVLNFTGGTLSETVYPADLPPLGRIQRTGSRVYSMQLCPTLCGGPSGIVGFDFQNGQLIPLPGSPYPYGEENDMVIY